MNDASQGKTGPECETVSVPEAGRIVGLGRNASYEAARRGEIPTIKFGGLLRVPLARLRRLLAGD